MAAMVDVGIILVILLLTYALMSEGLWGSALMFFNILFAALIAFNFYEFLAKQLADAAGSTVGSFADMLCLMVLFVVTLFILRLTTEQLAPAMVRFPTPVFHVGRVVFALAAASLAVSIMLLAFYLAPVHKKVFGVIGYDSKPPFKLGLDQKWLGFFQYTTGQVFARFGTGEVDPYREYGRSGGNLVPVRVFDPEGNWLIEHEKARPVGKGTLDALLEGEDSEGGSGSATTKSAPAAGGAPAGPPS